MFFFFFFSLLLKCLRFEGAGLLELIEKDSVFFAHLIYEYIKYLTTEEKKEYATKYQKSLNRLFVFFSATRVSSTFTTNSKTEKKHVSIENEMFFPPVACKIKITLYRSDFLKF